MTWSHILDSAAGLMFGKALLRPDPYSCGAKHPEAMDFSLAFQWIIRLVAADFETLSAL